MLPLYQNTEFRLTSNSSLSDEEFIDPFTEHATYCFSIENIVKTRRIFDMLASFIGLLLNTIHLAILIYLKFARNAKSYELLFSQNSTMRAFSNQSLYGSDKRCHKCVNNIFQLEQRIHVIQGVLSLLTLLFLFIGCLMDLCWVGISYSATWFRAHAWLFLVNSLMASYGFLIIALCIDRYVALNRPLYYRMRFAKRRTRWGLVVGSCILGMLFCARWIPFNTITDGNKIIENTKATRTWRYNMWRIFVYLEQYFFAGIGMCVLSYANIQKLHEIKRSYKEEQLGMKGEIKAEWIKNHTTISKICAILAISYVTFNWPYCVIDYLYTDKLAQTEWYGILTLIINLFQVLYIQLNLFFFAYCSKMYRSTLITLLKWPCRKIVAVYANYTHKRNGLHKIKEERMSTTTQSTVFTVC